MRRSLWLVLLALAACTRDTDLPETPLRGRIVGRLDTQGHISPVGQTVTLSSSAGDKRTGTTEANGDFSFGDLAPGLYLVSTAPPGFAKLSSDLLQVLAGTDTDVGVLSPTWLQNTPAEATLTGKVAANGGGDVTGAKVEFLLSGSALGQVTVAADGVFVMRLPPGSFTLRATHPAFVTAMLTDVVLGEAEVKDVSATPLVLDINPATLSGSVVKERDGLAPVPGAGATITLDTGQTTTVDAAGNYQLTGLAAGARQVRFTLAGFHDSVPSRPVTLKPGQTSTVDQVALLLDRGSIVGTVKLADSAAVSGARVELSGTSYAALVSPDAVDPSKGAFIIGNVPVGTWSVNARKDQYSNATATVTVSATAPADTGVLTLARLLGDFLIEDADLLNTAGYTRTPGVTLNFTGFPSTGVASYRASEDPSFDGGTFLPYTGRTQPFTLQNTEGVHTVYAQYTDTNGQQSQSFSASVVLDTIAPTLPTVSFESSGSAGTTRYINRSQDLRLGLSSSDGTGSGLSKMRIGETVDGMGNVTHATEAYSLTATLTRSSALDGLQRVYVQVLDNAGNVSDAGTDVVVVDTQAPSGDITLVRGPAATDDGFTNTPLQTVNETWADGDGGVVLIKLANSSGGLSAAVYQPTSASTAWFLDPVGEGTKTVFARFRDAAGNENVNVAQKTITYDITGPTPAAASLVTPATTRLPTVTLSFTTEATLSSTQALTLSDEASFTSAATVPAAPFPVSAQANFTLPAGDGVRSVFVRYKDRAGNTAVTSVSLTLDTTPPAGAFTVTGALADGTASTTLTATNQVTVTIVPGGATEYRLGDGTMTSCPTSGYTPLTNTTLSNQTLAASGVMTLCLRDAAGNPQGPLSQTLTIDSTPPSGCTLSLQGKRADGLTNATAGQTARPVVTATLSGCTGAATEYYLVNGTATCSATLSASWVGYSAPSTQPFLLSGGEGSNTVAACVRDAAKNVSAVTGVSINLDTTPPSALGVVINADAPYFNASQLTGANIVVSITGSATGATEWAFSESQPSSYQAFTGAAGQLTLGGQGTRVVYAVFRDALGNESSVVSDSIIVDTQPPNTMGAQVIVISPSSNGFINSTSGTVRSLAPSDAVSVQLAEAATPGTCAANDFSGVSSNSIATTYSFVFSSTNGNKTVCARWADAAGNLSGIVFDTKQLDTVAPAAPIIVSPQRTFNPLVGGESLQQLVDIVNAPDPQHLDWQVLGGTTTSWSPVDAGTQLPPQPLRVPYTLVTNSSARPGVPNILRVRERDQAGNVGDEASIVLTTDIVPPRAVTLSNFWTDNASGKGVVRWQKSPDTDVTGYQVFYGAASANPGGLPDAGSLFADGGYLLADGGYIIPTGYNGFYSTAGASPIPVNNQDYVALDGLPNGALTYVTVRPVDSAGNVGPAPLNGTREVLLQPNVVSPNLIMDLPTVRDAGVATPNSATVAVVNNYAYVFSPVSTGCPNGPSTLYAVDLSTLVSPVQGGAIQQAPPSPAIGTTSVVNDNVCGGAGDIVAEYPFLFTVGGNHFRVWSVVNPLVPTPITDLDLSTVVAGTLSLNTVDVRGNNAFVTGNGVFFYIDVSSLYDNNAATRPSVAGGSVKYGLGGGVSNAQGLGWARERVWYANANANGTSYDVSNAVDFSGATTFTIANRLTTTYPGIPTNHQHFGVSGNYMVSGENDGVHIYSLGPMFANSGTYVTELNSVPWGVRGQHQQVANELYMNETSSSGLSTFDLSAFATDIVTTGTTRATVGVAQEGLGIFGPYALQAAHSNPAPWLRVYELAIPRGLRIVHSFAQPSGHPFPTPGFVVFSSGLVVDMMTGGTPAIVGATNATFGCNDDGAVFDDTLLSTFDTAPPNDGTLRIIRLESAHARPSSPATMATLSTQVSLLPATTYARGVDRVGNYAIFATARDTPTTSVWLEAYRASGLRSTVTNGARSFTPGATAGTGDKVAEFQLATTVITSSVTKAWVRVFNGFAVVTTGNFSPSVYIVDIRPMLDDDATTTMTASNIVGSISGVIPKDAVLSGNTLYVSGTDNMTSQQGLFIYDATKALDGSTLTTVSAADLIATVPVPFATGLDVKGSYAIVTGYNITSGGLTSIDVSQRASPKVIGYMPYPVGFTGACATGKQFVTIAGTKAYVGGYERFDVIELE